MSALRLVMVSPRYWPLVGETECFLSDLAKALRDDVAQVTIVTGRWSPPWPREVVHREIPMVRVPHAPRGGLHTFRYMHALGRWLREHAQQIDLAYVMNVRHDAHTALGVLRERKIPVVLRARSGDCKWLSDAQLGRRMKRRVLLADAIVAPSQQLERELRQGGFDRRKIHGIADGATLLTPRTPAMRFQARTALAEINHDLSVAEYTPVAVNVGQFHEGRGLFQLVDGWRTIAAHWPGARLWLIGDGPLRQSLYERIIAHGLHHHIFMPGTFDDLEDVLLAADLFVEAGENDNGGWFLLQAMATGLPIIAADTPSHGDLIENGAQGTLVPPGDSSALATAIAAVLDAPQVAQRYGDAGRERVAHRYPFAKTVHEHLTLFEQLVRSQQRDTG